LPSDPTDRPLAEIVEAMLAGDAAATVTFHTVAEPKVRTITLRALRGAGIWVDPDRLYDIVQDGVLALRHSIGSWRPDGGATPWGWARPRLVAIAFEHVGIFADDLHGAPERPEPEPPCSAVQATPCPLDLLADLATTRPELADLHRALTSVATDRDGRVWIDLLLEECHGNRAAAVTVAQNHGLSHANVRKIRQRVQTRLVDLSRHEEFADLADLPVLAA
jgi:hypothetical protein